MKIIGIDPDVRKPGVCELVNGEIRLIQSMEIPLLLNFIDICIGTYIFAVEDISKTKAIYTRNKKDGPKGAMIAQKVGMSKGAHAIIVDYIKYYGGTVYDVPAGVGKQVKKNASLFAKITGYKGRTNEDNRDAWAIANHANIELCKRTK